VRLFNYMNKLVSQKEIDETKVVQQSESSHPVVHRSVTCDGCQMFPIQGNRYKCYVCPDFDLCEMCEEANKHRTDHPMLKIRFPVQNRSVQNRSCSMGQCNRKAYLPRASFIEDITLRDGISCYPGITVLKIWALKNNGETRWPEGVHLLFLSGELTPKRLMEVPRAESGDVVNVSAEIELPIAPKQYTGYYRLATAEGKKFGPRIWVDLIVVQPEKEVKMQKEPEKPIEEKQPESLDAPKVDSPAPNTDTDVQIQIIASASVSELPRLEENKADAKQDPNGAPMDAKKPEETVIPVQKSEEPHIQMDTKEPVKKQEQPKVQVPSPYAQQLEILAGMGFQETELNSYLLANNEGNVQRVVEWILSHGVN